MRFWTQMDEAGKRRLAGAAVLVALAVIFVPMLIDDEQDEDLGEPIVIPEPPKFDTELDDLVGPSMDRLDEAPPLPESAVSDEPPPLPTPPPPDAEEPAPAPAPEVAPAPEPAPAPAPEPAAEPEQQVADEPAPAAQEAAVAGPRSVPPGTQAWVVQVASLRSPEAARELQDRLRADGFPAFIEQARVGGQLYHRVRIGPEVNRAQADAIAQRVASEVNSDPLVQSYP